MAATKKAGRAKDLTISIGTIRIGKETFQLMIHPCADKLVFAEVSLNGKMIGINPRYSVVLDDLAALTEHQIGCVLQAVAIHHHPHDAAAAAKMAAKLRRQLGDAASLHELIKA